MGARLSRRAPGPAGQSSALQRLLALKRKNRKEYRTPLGFCDDVHAQDALFSRENAFYFNTACLPLNEMHMVVCEGDIRSLQYFLTVGKFELNHKDKDERNALHFACFYGQPEMVAFLVNNHCEINAKDIDNNTPLMKAAQSWEDKIVRFLLQHGADLNIKDVGGDSVLHHAVYAGKPATAARLLTYGADIEEHTKDGFTPLMLALRERRVRMAQFLIKMNANVYVSDRLHRNTLMYAVRCDSEDLVSLLLQRGLDMYAEDIFEWTAFHYASRGGCKVNTLLLEFDYNLTLNLRKIHPALACYNENSSARPSIQTSTGSSSVISKKNTYHPGPKGFSKNLTVTCVDDLSGTRDETGENMLTVQVDGKDTRQDYMK